MDSDDEEENFPKAELDDPVWSEEPISNRQQLCIYQITCHITRQATPSPQPIKEEVLPEPEQTDVAILDDLLDVIDVPKNFPLILTIRHTVCWNNNGEMIF